MNLSENLADLIQSEADRCVKCALCAPHCPTYGLTRDEGDSPRGRIALMQGLAEGRLSAGGRLDFHLDRCLACRACERVCPSGVRYGRLIDAARAYGATRQRPLGRPGRLARWLLDGVIPDRRRLARLARWLRLYQQSGARRLLQVSGLLRLMGRQRLDSLMPEIPAAPRWHGYYPPEGKIRGEVALFTGCIGNVLDRDALEASIRLLNACGYGVHVPAAQTCCGGLHLHGGDLRQAAALARRNLDAFDGLANGAGLAAVVYTASGCGATLAEYDQWPAADGLAPPGRFAAPVVDVCSFLERSGALAELEFARLDATVAVHDPCTLRNVVRATEAPYRLLGLVPGLAARPLANNARCCGAAGSYLLTEPALADALRADKLAAIRDAAADIVVSSNLGCALFLAAGLRGETGGSGPAVMHPATLLARQLGIRAGTRSSSSPSTSATSAS